MTLSALRLAVWPRRLGAFGCAAFHVSRTPAAARRFARDARGRPVGLAAGAAYGARSMSVAIPMPDPRHMLITA